MREMSVEFKRGRETVRGGEREKQVELSFYLQLLSQLI